MTIFKPIDENKANKKVQKVFSNNFKPYEIGFISKEKSNIKVSGKIRW